jgi:hypothetical protein
LSAKLVPTFADRECRVVSATDLTAVNLDFLDPDIKLVIPIQAVETLRVARG